MKRFWIVIVLLAGLSPTQTISANAGSCDAAYNSLISARLRGVSEQSAQSALDQCMRNGGTVGTSTSSSTEPGAWPRVVTYPCVEAAQRSRENVSFFSWHYPTAMEQAKVYCAGIAEQAKALADKAAADKAAADKAAADKVLADKAAADAAIAKAAAELKVKQDADAKAATDKAAADKVLRDKAAAADEARNSAYAATDAALAAADVADATRAANEDALEDSDGADLAKISLQREKLDVAYISATTALANVTTAYDNARAQVVKFQALMNAATDASEKQALATALSKLANATLTLSGSRSKLVGQMNVLDAKKSFLLSAEEKLLTKAKVGGASTSSAKPAIKEKIIVCTKGKSSLKVIGKNPKCPAGYKKK